MIVKPRIWGFICTTAHPIGCEKNVHDQIEFIRQQGEHKDGPRRVLVIGASTGYGLAARITAAFGYGAETLGVFFEKSGRSAKTGTAGWYNSAAFDKFAGQAGVRGWSINGDAFSNAARERVIELAKQEMDGPIDLVIYSLAAPARRLPGTGELVHTALKPIGAPFSAKTINTDKDELVDITLEPATQQEIDDTVTVMGGADWSLWIEALSNAGVLAERAKTIAFSYIGPEVTWPIYWHGTIGRAKQHLDATADILRTKYAGQGLDARVAVMKSIVTQASAAIPVIPLYISLIYKVMKQKGLHEGAIEQQHRLFSDFLYRPDGAAAAFDNNGYMRLDDRELRDDVQQACKDLWPQVTQDNLFELTDYAGYKQDFLRLFGFARDDVDYDADVVSDIDYPCIKLAR